MVVKHGAPPVPVETAYQSSVAAPDSPAPVATPPRRKRRSDCFDEENDPYDPEDAGATVEFLNTRPLTMLVSVLDQSKLCLKHIKDLDSPRGALEEMLATLGMRCTTDYASMDAKKMQSVARRTWLAGWALLRQFHPNPFGGWGGGATHYDDRCYRLISSDESGTGRDASILAGGD
jgi:hypothetical protein